MHYSKTAVATIVLLSLGVLAVESPIPGYNVTTIAWEVDVVRDGPRLILNGTVEEVYSQILERNPNYEAEFGTIDERAAASEALNKRQSWDGGDWLCGVFARANRVDIYNGISYLQGLSGSPTNGPGPGNCGRVSCSYNSAIWWCNDNASDETLDNFGVIATGAQMIADNCIGEWNWDSYTAGQAFNSQSFNVIVRGDSC